MSITDLQQSLSFMVKIIILQTDLCSSELSQTWKTKGSSANPHPFQLPKNHESKVVQIHQKILLNSGLNFPAAKRPRLSEWAEGYAGLRMKALQGRNRNLSTPELPMSVVGGLRRWSARLLKPPMEEPQEARAILHGGFWYWIFFDPKNRWVGRKGSWHWNLKSDVLFKTSSSNVWEVEIWWGMWDSYLEKKEGSAFEDLSWKFVTETGRQRLMESDRQSPQHFLLPVFRTWCHPQDHPCLSETWRINCRNLHRDRRYSKDPLKRWVCNKGANPVKV